MFIGRDNSGVIAEFYIRPKQNKAKSLEAGRPIFDDREYVRITIPGDKNTELDKPVQEEHKHRWPEVYKAFKEGIEYHGEGTPLKEWTAIRASQAAELAALRIFTVEDLANLPDAGLDRIGMGARALQAQAKAYLQTAKDEALPQKMAAENEALKAEIKRLQDQMAELASLVKENPEQSVSNNQPLGDRPNFVPSETEISGESPLTKVHLGRGMYKVFRGDEVIAEKVPRKEAEAMGA